MHKAIELKWEKLTKESLKDSILPLPVQKPKQQIKNKTNTKLDPTHSNRQTLLISSTNIYYTK